MSTNPIVNDVGFESGTGTLDNPIGIEEVVITFPKKEDPTQNKNFFDRLIEGVKGVGNFLDKLTGSNSESSWIEKGGDALAKFTEKSREFYLSKGTMLTLFAGGVGLISYYFYQKNKR